MRVVNSSMYNKFTSSVNDVHGKLNKAMNKVSTGAAYENAAENPLAYYRGKQIDQLYQNTLSRNALIGDLKNRLSEQERGTYDIQQLLNGAKTAVQYLSDSTHNSDKNTVQTKRDELLQRAQSMVNNLNAQYGNYYVFGGNDVTSTPFSLSADGSTLTFTHKFTDGKTETMTMTMEYDDKTKTYGYKISDDDMNLILKAMTEQGRVDICYGNINNPDTLLDTYTGGLNMLTGLTSDALKSMAPDDAKKAIEEGLNKSVLGLTSISVMASDKYIKGDIDSGAYSKTLGELNTGMTVASQTLSRVYSDLGNKANLLDTTSKQLDSLEDSLTIQYKDILGADPYEAIMEMYSYQYSYSAALKVGSNLMQSSLFDFLA